MSQANEQIIIDLHPDRRLSLYGHITAAMEKQGYIAGDYDTLVPELDLPVGWPVDASCEITLAQLVVIARKLRLRLVIDGLYAEELFKE